MMKKLLIIASLVAPLVAVAADVATTNAVKARTQNKKSMLILCQQQATEKKLDGAEKKKFLAKCVSLSTSKDTPAAK